jgi:hypothetical protein
MHFACALNRTGFESSLPNNFVENAFSATAHWVLLLRPVLLDSELANGRYRPQGLSGYSRVRRQRSQVEDEAAVVSQAKFTGTLAGCQDMEIGVEHGSAPYLPPEHIARRVDNPAPIAIAFAAVGRSGSSPVGWDCPSSRVMEHPALVEALNANQWSLPLSKFVLRSDPCSRRKLHKHQSTQSHFRRTCTHSAC